MNIKIKKSRKPVKYNEAIVLLEKKLTKINNGEDEDFIWILEHEEIYTAGTSYNKKEILNNNINLIKTNRGGKITYHGPGQIICYFVIDLKKRNKDIRKFITLIEKTIIESLLEFKIHSFADPKNIGIGQYQHDVDEKLLKKSLDAVVESCVNSIGVDVNTASKYLLTYVSGVGPVLAENIVSYREENGTFNDREELLKVPRMGDKVYEQCAGFLRVLNGVNPLDNSAVHPERYQLVKEISKDCGISVESLIGNDDLLGKVKMQEYVCDEVGLPTIQDIIEELSKPGRDPRQKAKVFEFSKLIRKIEDVKLGMRLPGIVTNITNFGCFVDIGVKQDGLLHISNMADRFISDPNTVVSLHEHIEVEVLEVDIPRSRIGFRLLLK